MAHRHVPLLQISHGATTCHDKRSNFGRRVDGRAALHAAYARRAAETNLEAAEEVGVFVATIVDDDVLDTHTKFQAH